MRKAMHAAALALVAALAGAPAHAEDDLTDPDGLPLFNWITGMVTSAAEAKAAVPPPEANLAPTASPAAAPVRTAAKTPAPAKPAVAASAQQTAIGTWRGAAVRGEPGTYQPSWFGTWGAVTPPGSTAPPVAAPPAAAPVQAPARTALPPTAPVATLPPQSPAPTAAPPPFGLAWFLGGASASMRPQPKQTLDPRYARTEVAYDGKYPIGTIVVDTAARHLYHVRPDGKAMRYGIGVGRQGFTWKGTANIRHKAEWPAWHPPADMRAREPWLPARMEGGPENPLGARALYLYQGDEDTLYRIHGTNQPETIGQQVSSGCIRLVNDDIVHLYGNVKMGARVVVL
jgi:lipoprotein-anchoring transpeptidase ErfK/SrfK